MRLVAAPNAFKGSLGSVEAAAAISRGLREALPEAEIIEAPIADGGEGTMRALVAAARGEQTRLEVEGPLGEAISAQLGLIDGGRTAVVELAASSGLTLVPPERRSPGTASSFGFGQLLLAARGRGVSRIVAAVGGSATNDGGAGMAQALGYRLLDLAGRELPRGGAALIGLDRIDRSGFNAAWRDLVIEVAVDVTNPLTGPAGASAVYGPQKGASPKSVEELEAALGRLRAVVRRDLGVDPGDLPGAGAGGGAGFGLAAFLGARLTGGAALVADAAGLDEALAGAAAVFTGEGRLDAQTAYGKGPAEVARRGRAAGAKVVILAGSLGEGWRTVTGEGVFAVPIAEGPASAEEMEAAAERLIEGAAARAGRLLAADLAPGGRV